MPNETNLRVGFHRSRALANRRARELRATIVGRRAGSGKFSKRGHYFYFLLPESKLTRYTIGITFPYHKEYGSVLAQLYTSKWEGDGRSLRSKKDRGATREAAIRKVEEVIRFKRERFWFDLDSVIATETTKVDYDSKFAERIVVFSEVDDEESTTTYRRK